MKPSTPYQLIVLCCAAVLICLPSCGDASDQSQDQLAPQPVDQPDDNNPEDQPSPQTSAGFTEHNGLPISVLSFRQFDSELAQYKATTVLDGTVLRPLVVNLSSVEVASIWINMGYCGTNAQIRLDSVESSDPDVFTISEQGPQRFTMNPLAPGNATMSMTMTVLGIEGTQSELIPGWVREPCRLMRAGTYTIEASHEVIVRPPVKFMRIMDTLQGRCNNNKALVMMSDHLHQVHALTEHRASLFEPAPLNGYDGEWAFIGEEKEQTLGLASYASGSVEITTPPERFNGMLTLPNGSSQYVRVIHPEDIGSVEILLQKRFGDPLNEDVVEVQSSYIELTVGLPQFLTQDYALVQHPGSTSPMLTIETPDVCQQRDFNKFEGNAPNLGLHVDFITTGECVFTVYFPTFDVEKQFTVEGI